MPGGASNLLLTAAQTMKVQMGSDAAADPMHFERQFFAFGVPMQTMKTPLQTLFDERDKQGDRLHRMSESDAGLCLHNFLHKWMGPIMGSRNQKHAGLASQVNSQSCVGALQQLQTHCFVLLVICVVVSW